MLDSSQRRQWLLALAVLASGILAINIYFLWAPRRVPGGQAELVHLDANSIETLKKQFNEAEGTRLVALLSPT